MITMLTRGCPSWTPVPGWQDLGGCWTPPPVSWWTPARILAAGIPLALALGVALGAVTVLARYGRDLRSSR